MRLLIEHALSFLPLKVRLGTELPVEDRLSFFVLHVGVKTTWTCRSFLFFCLQPVSVETPQGGVYEGKRLSGKRVSLACMQLFLLNSVPSTTAAFSTRVFVQITGVSILRAGETMEQALMAVCKDIRLGKILIQTNHDTGEPEV